MKKDTFGQPLVVHAAQMTSPAQAVLVQNLIKLVDIRRITDCLPLADDVIKVTGGYIDTHTDS